MMTTSSFRILPWLLAGLLLGSPALASEIKIGYVDLQKALTLTDEGRIAKERLKKDFDVKQKKLDQAQEELKKEKEAFDKQSQLWTEDKRREEEQTLQKKFQEATVMWQQMQKDLSDAEAKETSQIFQKMEVIIHDMAEAEGFTHVFDRKQAGLIYAPESMDLTPELVRKYNERYSAKKTNSGGGSGGKSSSQTK
jgi:outer membrane protein